MRKSRTVLTSFTALRQRVLAVLGAISMYRLVLFALIALAAVAVLLSLAGLVGPSPLELLVSFAVLAAATSAVDAAAQRLLHLPWRIESSLVTALILLFVLQPSISPGGLAGLAIAGALASLSKYLIAWRGRHILNPAAFGAAVVTIAGGLGAGWLGTFSSWWVGTPAMAVPVALLGLAVLWRTEKVRLVLVFLVVAVAVTVLRQAVQAQAAELSFAATDAVLFALTQSPLLYLGAFMLSEPLTLPPRRWQQFCVAALVGVLAGWPLSVAGLFTLGQERALLIGNLLAFAFALRGSVRLVLESRRFVTPTAQELTFRTRSRLRFVPGQYLELDVPHRHPDVRGTRREFSIVSAPADLPTLRIAYKEGDRKHPSSYKRALAAAQPGAVLAVTGTWGDFVLPRGDAPVLMVAAGIGVTPFVSQLRQLQATGRQRDMVLVYVASEAAELAFRDELEQTGARVIVFTRDEPADLPPHWTWAQGVRLDAAGLERVVPDLASRHAFISGPPRLIADLAPALQKARSLTTDAFAGY
ncbi:FAD-dependent oxidoreductase [Microbacterium neungamense]|nr:FAD-dependent oxidoreductase [Microbacterium neungamense]UWF76930.1 FAD-dependent oxidoreductase [Microbacterium neungamense]